MAAPWNPSSKPAAASHGLRRVVRVGLVALTVAALGAGVASAQIHQSKTHAASASAWVGTWKTTWGTLTFTQKGFKVTGTFTTGTGKITGSVASTKLSGVWSKAPSYKGTDAGSLLLTLSADSKSFTGQYKATGATAWAGKITGTFASGPVNLSWNGTWATSHGTIVFNQFTTNAVTGAYTPKEGRIDATANEYSLNGNWSEEPSYSGPSDAGLLQFTLSKDGRTFTGTYGKETASTGKSWTGVRIGPAE